MLRKNKFDFVVYGTGYKRLVALFFAFFICSLTGFINLYGIEKRNIGIDILVSIALIVFFGGITIFLYSIWAGKIYIFKNEVIIKKWYGLRKKIETKDITKVVLEKSEGKIATAQIFVGNFNDKYTDCLKNFEKLVKYLVLNVEEEKIECYFIGTKEKTTMYEENKEMKL